MTKLLVINADGMEKTNEISDEKLEEFLPLIQVINTHRSNNWITNEHLDGPLPREMYSQFNPDLIADFDCYVPYGDYGVLTIRSIAVFEVIDEKKLLPT